jgi:NhaP-type Na+/H+ or K+/H+ antiporter
LRVPAILFLLLAGIGIGPIAGWLRPEAVFGELLFPLVSLAVAVILFEGSLTLKFAEIAGLERVVRRFVTTGVLVTWLVVTLATRHLLGFSWELAALFGAIMVVTGPTVIVPMLRTVRPTPRIASILRWEGIVIDPVGAVLAVLVFQYMIAAEAGAALVQTLINFLELIGAGVLAGLAAGFALGEALRRDWLPAYLDNMATLVVVFAAFVAANELASESGLLAVTVMGIYLANRKGVPVEDIMAFKESLSLLLISGLFILLAARLELVQLREMGWAALWVFLIVQFVARPLKVLVATFGSALSWRERALLAWIAPRGIVAAAVSALFALELGERGYPQAQWLVPLTFVVIIGTVVLQSLTAGPLARVLGVAEPAPLGVLVVGANPLARAIARALTKYKVKVLLTDSHWDDVHSARMDGLDAYYGHPLSEHAETYLDLAGLGKLLALTADPHLNALVCARFRADFGRESVHALAVRAQDDPRIAALPPREIAFGAEVTYGKLAGMLARGAEIRVTRLTERFDFDAYRARYGDGAVPLLALDPRSRVEVFTAGRTPEPKAEWSILALVEPGPKTLEAALPVSYTPGTTPAEPDSMILGG